MNFCKDCMRKHPRRPPVTCPECGKQTLSGELQGATMLLKCTNCGYDIVGASFFPPCREDFKTRYTLSVSDIEKDKYVKVAGVFGMNVVQLKHLFDAGMPLTASELDLDSVVSLAVRLAEADIPFEINPSPLKKYPEIFTCTLR